METRNYYSKQVIMACFVYLEKRYAYRLCLSSCMINFELIFNSVGIIPSIDKENILKILMRVQFGIYK